MVMLFNGHTEGQSVKCYSIHLGLKETAGKT